LSLNNGHRDTSWYDNVMKMNLDTPLSINITTGTIVKTLIVLALAYTLFLLRDIVLVLLTAVVIASAVEPAARWLMKYKIPRLPSVVFVYLIIALGIFGVFYFVVPPLLSETVGFLSTVPDYLGTLDFSALLSKVGFLSTGGVLPDTFGVGEVVSGFRSYLTDIPGSVFATVSTIFGGALSLALIIVFSFYLTVQENGIVSFLQVVTPYRHQKYAIDLWRRSQHKIGLWMQGQLLLMLIIGVLVYLGLTIMGVKHAFLFAILAAAFELIPLFGPVLASIPAIAVGFVTGGVTLGLIIIGLYVIIQQFENHLIYPLVVNKVVGVPALLVILALIIGAQIAGFLGILLSVPIAAALMEFTNDIQKKNRALAAVEDDTSA